MPEIAQLAQYIRDQGGLDLHDTDLGPIAIPGWEGLPVHLYRYYKDDPDGTRKWGKIALLDASPEQIARWIYTAVVTVNGNYNLTSAHQLVDHCAEQSGFQFPVRGIHWENLAGTHEAYTFFDGVTVRLNGWTPSWPTTVLPDEQLDEAIGATIDDVAETRKYGRIQSTTRQEYIDNGGQLPVDGNHWLATVRTCYQAAWNNDSNELMTAKARALL